MEGKKFDNGKPPLGLVPGIAIREIAKVLAYGAEKYDRYNWLKGMKWSRLYDAALRHLYAWIDGDACDEETNLSHLSHLGCCVMFLIVYEKLGIGEDDRYIIVKKDISDTVFDNVERGPECDVKVCNTIEDINEVFSSTDTPTKDGKLSKEEIIQSYIDNGNTREQAEDMFELIKFKPVYYNNNKTRSS